MDHDTTIRTPIGCTLSFNGYRVLHGGGAVSSGTRYILAVFLYYDESGGDSRDQQKQGVKRSFSEANGVIQESKQYKVDFSFGFAV